MSTDHTVNLLRALHAKKLNRRSMMAAAAMIPAAGLLAGRQCWFRQPAALALKWIRARW